MHRTLSSKGRLAVSAMVELARRSRHGPVTLDSLRQHQRISRSYLDQLFARLRRHGLVSPTHGPGGGYALSRAACDISVADIIRAVDPPSLSTACEGHAHCMGQGTGHCLTHALWTAAKARLVEGLDAISLQALVDERCAPRELPGDVLPPPTVAVCSARPAAPRWRGAGAAVIT
jgi:Rrf2 family iron-sulfur cluster assembly transcriptional regulator